jgi:hypothetical protein
MTANANEIASGACSGAVELIPWSHGRARPGPPRLPCWICRKKDVDARDKRRHDGRKVIRSHRNAPLMPEMPGTGEHHGDAVIVGCLDDFVVAHRAARLNYSGRAGLDRHQKPV